MLSFRSVAVFIALISLVVGLVSVADASSHQRSRSRSRAVDPEMRGGPGKPEMILQGPVTSVHPDVGFIVMRHGAGKDAEEIPIEVDSRTTVTRGGKKVGTDEIKVGDRVRISYSGTVADVSKTVEVMGGPSMRSGRRA